MVIFTCQKCEKKFTKKSSYVYHTLKRKVSCIPIVITDSEMTPIDSEILKTDSEMTPKCSKNELNCSKIAPKCQKNELNCSKINYNNNIESINSDPKLVENKKKSYICEYCKRNFTKSCNLGRHYLRCKVIKKLSEDTDNIQLKEELKICKSEMKKYEEKIAILEENHNKIIKDLKKLSEEKTIVNKNTNTNNNNNNQNTQSKNNNSFNTVNNINIIQFGKEDYSKITNQEFSEIMTKFGINIPVSLIEKIHLNDERPEFKNLYVTDINRDKAMVFNGKDWELESFNNIKDDLLDKSIDYIENKCEELKENNKVPEGSKKLMDVKLHSINKLKPFDSEDEEDYLGCKLTKREKTTRKKLRQKAHDTIKRKLYNNKEKSKTKNN